MSKVTLNPLTRTGNFSAANQGMLQRKCACGNQAASGGTCESCAKKNSLQRQMRVGSNSDPLEHEADRVADQVMAHPKHQFADLKPNQIKPSTQTSPAAAIQRQSNSSTGPAVSELPKPPIATFGQDKDGDFVVGAENVPEIGSIPKLPADPTKLPGKINKLLHPDAESKKGTADCRGLQGFAPTTASQFKGSCCKGIASKENCCTPDRIGINDISPRCCKETEAVVGGRCVEMKDQGVQPEPAAPAARPKLPKFSYRNYEVPKPVEGGLKLTPPTFDYGYKPKPVFDYQLKLRSLKEIKNAEEKAKEQEKNKNSDESGIQKKLSVGASNDPLEHEADRVADQVLANPSGAAPISSSISNVQRHSANTAGQTQDAPESVDQTLSGSGAPLDKSVRSDMESRFGHDFSHVRIHQGSNAEKSALDVNANAYTLGNNIVFGAGQYNPHSQTGKRLLAHELTHVIQQSGVVRPYRPKDAFNFGKLDTPELVEDSFDPRKDKNRKPWIKDVEVKFSQKKTDSDGNNFWEGEANAHYFSNVLWADFTFPISGGSNELGKTSKGNFVVTRIEGVGYNSGKYSGNVDKNNREGPLKRYSKDLSANMHYAVFYNGGEALHMGPLDASSHGCVHVDFGNIQRLNYHSVIGLTKVSVTYP